MKKIIITVSIALLGATSSAGFVSALGTGVEIIGVESSPVGSNEVKGESTLQVGSLSVENGIEVETTNGVVGKVYVLDASQSQDDGVIKTFLWRQTSGPTAKLSSTTSMRPTFTPTVASTYTFELVATDRAGLSSAIQKSIFIIGNDAPSVSVTATGDPDFDLLNIGDPDFDLFNINITSDAISKFRAEAVAVDQMGNVNFTSNAKEVKTSEDFKNYVEAVVLNDEAIGGIKINKDTIEVESREQGKLFGFIPVNMTSYVVVKYKLMDSSEDTAYVKVKFPWWHIFVKKYGNSPGGVQIEIKNKLSESGWFKVDNSEAPTDLSLIAQTFEVISSILKTKHDTVKNSIGNIR